MRSASLSVVLGLAACGGAAPPPVQPAPASSAASAPTATVTKAPAEEEWHCTGEQALKFTGWKQATAFDDAAAPSALERVAEAAARKLESQLCGGDPAACPALRARIATWKTGSNAKTVCAMAVVKAEELDEWRKLALSVGQLDRDIEKGIPDLLSAKVSKTTRVTIDRIVDAGIPGGQRADWLRSLLEAKLAGKVELVLPPRGWAGDGLPPGVDVSLRGELIARSEGQVRVVDATFQALKSSGRATVILGTTRVRFPEAAAPVAGTITAPKMVEPSPGLGVHIDSHEGGSLCAGERTQIWLKSDADAVVRVFDLYGTSQALLVWPGDENASGGVKAGLNVSLGAFEAVPAPGSEAERFIVIAAPNVAGLGRFGNLKGTCRLPATVARELHEGRGLPPGVKTATDGYRLVSGPSCGAPPPEEKRRAAAAALAGLPECQVTVN